MLLTAMSQPDMLSLTWASFPAHPSDIFQQLLTTRDQADLTLVCEDLKHIRTHKFILSCCSPVFRSILSEMTSPQPVVFLRGIHSVEMEAVLEYLYLGQTQISQQRVDQFFKVATDLKIKDISKEYIKENQESRKTEATMETVVEEAENHLTETTNDEVENHVKVENYEIYACNYCKRKFTLKNSLRRHIETIHPKSAHSCGQCESSFTDQTSLDHHIQSVHDGGTKLSCRYCLEKYSSKAGLKFHMKRVHKAQ